ncbi:arsenate reductase family protein [Marivita sp. S2033]|uniref:arsenate reductase family protein n=1 Tax=Marivita sp. S2033 TaxID=3373187 RepID=UPI003981E694
MILYGLKNCDTCRKAVKALPDAQLRDVSVTPVPPDILRRAYAQFGDALVNKQSTTWRGLDADERDQDARTLLSAYPKLMKRPLIVNGYALHLGWSAATQSKLGI